MEKETELNRSDAALIGPCGSGPAGKPRRKLARQQLLLIVLSCS